MKRGGAWGFPLPRREKTVDKRPKRDKIGALKKAATKPRGPRRDKREGTVEALRDTGPQATSPAAREDRDASSPLPDDRRRALFDRA